MSRWNVFAKQNLLSAAAVFILAVLPGRSTAAETKPPRPNVLIILVDDLGWGDLSVQGARDLQTPHLDALAASGIRFSNFYANCTVCSPTRAALLTGRYPDLVGVPGVIRTHREDNWGYLQPNGPTLPEQLQKAGYRTGLVGKWHLGLISPNTPNERGFQSFHGFLGDMMDDYYLHRRHDINYLRENDREIDPQGHATDLFSDWAGDFIQKEKSAHRPWFLYLAYNAPHTPIQPPADWLQRVKLRQPGLDEKRARLVALIEHLDAGIGRVLATLRESGQSENTLVIFTSDNGGQMNVGGFNGPYRGGKQDAYEGGLRVPFFASWPGGIKPGSTSVEVALTMDLYATACEVAGIAVSHPIDGRSLLPLLTGRLDTVGQRSLVWMRREGGLNYGGQCYYAYREGPWKLLQNTPYSPLELYNLDDDPGELTNVLNEQRKIANDLSAGLRRHIQRSGAVPWQRLGTE